MRKVLVAFAISGMIFVTAGCTRPQQARQSLEDAGYTNIQTGGWSMFGCGEDDDFATQFRATAPSGQCVRGVVCSGLLKGATIRNQGRC